MQDRSCDLYGLCGQIIDGRYRVHEVVGQGGFGIVYRAVHLGFDAQVALKVLKLPSDADQTTREALLASFKREGKLLFELCALHRAIVQVMDTGVVIVGGRGAVPYLALEWLDGEGLNTGLVRRRRSGTEPVSLEHVLGLLHPLAEALAAAHSRGIAHRDVKPGNIFLCRTGDVVAPKLLDFGIAKVVGDHASTTELFEATAHGAPFTALYAAPEQWVGRLGATGTWTDVYAFALVMSEMLSGQQPGGDGDPLRAMGTALDEAMRPTPGTLGAPVSDPVEQVFVRALSVNPRTRIRTLGEFWPALLAAAGLPPDSSPAPVSSSDWDWPNDPTHQPESVLPVQESVVSITTLPTEAETIQPIDLATGGPVVSATQGGHGSPLLVRGNRMATSIVAIAAFSLLGIGWMAAQRGSSAAPSPAPSLPVPGGPSEAVPSSAGTTSFSAPAPGAVNPASARSSTALKSISVRHGASRPPITLSTASAATPVPIPAASEVAEPPAEEILKSRR